MQVNKILTYIILTAIIAMFDSIMAISAPAPIPEPKAIAGPLSQDPPAPPANSADPEGLLDPTVG